MCNKEIKSLEKNELLRPHNVVLCWLMFCDCFLLTLLIVAVVVVRFLCVLL